MTSKTEKKKTIHILPNISKSKDNKTMKFGQLIDYNTKNIFLENCNFHSQNLIREAGPRRFYKKSKAVRI